MSDAMTMVQADHQLFGEPERILWATTFSVPGYEVVFAARRADYPEMVIKATPEQGLPITRTADALVHICEAVPFALPDEVVESLCQALDAYEGSPEEAEDRNENLPTM